MTVFFLFELFLNIFLFDFSSVESLLEKEIVKFYFSSFENNLYRTYVLESVVKL